jgi:CubicO group peptidase (beta-lactamase class C family)
LLWQPMGKLIIYLELESPRQADIKIKVDSKFKIASITKTFTAVLILKLDEK